MAQTIVSTTSQKCLKQVTSLVSHSVMQVLAPFTLCHTHSVATITYLTAKPTTNSSLAYLKFISKKFNIKVVENFINSFDFKDKDIVESLRLLFLELPLSGEGQIVDRIVQIFGKKYHRENPTKFTNPDLSYYIAFSIIMLNTDLHREEVEKKMTKQQYTQQFIVMCPNEKIDEEYLGKIYDEILKNPLVIPGQKLSIANKNKQDLLKLEKESILSTTYGKFKGKKPRKPN